MGNMAYATYDVKGKQVNTTDNPGGGGGDSGDLTTTANGFVSLGLIMSGGSPSTSLSDQNGNTPAILNFNVGHRIGTYAALSALTDLAPGENAVCTDYPCRFVNYSSSPAAGTVVWDINRVQADGSNLTGSAMVVGDYAPVLVTTLGNSTSHPGDNAIIDGSGYFMMIKDCKTITVNCVLTFPADAARTGYGVRILQEDTAGGGTYIGVIVIAQTNNLYKPAPATGIARELINFTAVVDPALYSTTKRMRLEVIGINGTVTTAVKIQQLSIIQTR